MPFSKQALVLARLAQTRLSESQLTSKQLEELFHNFALPKPTNISDASVGLEP
jgi:hypothetical protein